MAKRTSVSSLSVVGGEPAPRVAQHPHPHGWAGQDAAALGIDGSSPAHLMLHRFNIRDLTETLKGKLKARETQEPATQGEAMQEAGMSYPVLMLPLIPLYSTAVRSRHTGHSSGCFWYCNRVHSFWVHILCSLFKCMMYIWKTLDTFPEGLGLLTYASHILLCACLHDWLIFKCQQATHSPSLDTQEVLSSQLKRPEW